MSTRPRDAPPRPDRTVAANVRAILVDVLVARELVEVVHVLKRVGHDLVRARAAEVLEQDDALRTQDGRPDVSARSRCRARTSCHARARSRTLYTWRQFARSPTRFHSIFITSLHALLREAGTRGRNKGWHKVRQKTWQGLVGGT